MEYAKDIQGSAALSICESTLICPGDLEILCTRNIAGILEDAKNLHALATAQGLSQTDHQGRKCAEPKIGHIGANT